MDQNTIENMKENSTELPRVEMKAVSGGDSEWDGDHTCDFCHRVEMVFQYYQPWNGAYVYKCPSCGNVEGFPY